VAHEWQCKTRRTANSPEAARAPSLAFVSLRFICEKAESKNEKGMDANQCYREFLLHMHFFSALELLIVLVNACRPLCWSIFPGPSKQAPTKEPTKEKELRERRKTKRAEEDIHLIRGSTLRRSMSAQQDSQREQRKTK
jgi:hypothetical protein